MKKLSKFIKILIVILLLLLIGFIIYNKLIKSKETIKIVKVEKRIEGFNYTLNENEIDFYKDKFNELEEVLTSDEIDYEDYAKLISELFIIDFYTLDNKTSKYDIGGVEFLDKSIKDNFSEKARNTFYKYVSTKNNGEGLPIVSEITNIELTDSIFKYKDKTETDCYIVNISWNYKEDLEFQDSAKITIVKNDKKLNIIEIE